MSTSSVTPTQPDLLGHRQDYLGLDVVDTSGRKGDAWRELASRYLHRPRFVITATRTGPFRPWFEDAAPVVRVVEDEFGVVAASVLEVTRLDRPLLLVTGWVGLPRESLTGEQMAYFADLRLPGVRLVEHDAYRVAGQTTYGLRFVVRPMAHAPRCPPMPSNRGPSP